jgi:Acetyltransferase (GNAT) domain
MKTIVYEDPEECRQVWERFWPGKGLFDLWQVRSCFHQVFSRPLHFRVVEKNQIPVGFLALCWDGEKQQYVQFPGETWQGKTWLEQNKIIAQTPEVMAQLLDSIPGPVHLRYLEWNSVLGLSNRLEIDEIGYCFYPALHDFSFENYYQSFSGKFRKKLKADLKKLTDRKVSFRFNDPKDVDHLFRLNQEAFGQSSYFSEARFYNAFERLAEFLTRMGMMRITTVLIDGAVAAVDMGALYKNSYTLLAGGTNPEFPGVAKLINLHHMEWSCHQGIETVDFLCGDFNWKERFHLTPRPLYELKLNNALIYNGLAFEAKGQKICA